jgi:hypothetical protein
MKSVRRLKAGFQPWFLASRGGCIRNHLLLTGALQNPESGSNLAVAKILSPTWFRASGRRCIRRFSHAGRSGFTRKSVGVLLRFSFWSSAIYAELPQRYRLETADCVGTPHYRENIKMDFTEASNGFVRDPLAWAADCFIRANSEDDPEARDAYEQLAQEFQSAWAEIEGLVGTFEALNHRKQNSKLV